MLRSGPKHHDAAGVAIGYLSRMTTSAKMAAIAALVGEAGRARMLTALMDGRAMTATELAQLAGISASTASGHLGKLTRAGLLAVLSQGRHRYFRLASPAVARLLESIMVVAGEPIAEQSPAPRIGRLLREARTCYDHLAGRLGVALTDALIHKGAIELGDEAGRVTEFGESFLQSFGISLEDRRQSRRLYCRPCLDWSERRFHLAGVLGSALLARTLELGWIVRADEGRAVSVTPKGRRGFSSRFGVEA
jgi:DNA-binding transcriptional ArsR family regulator